MFISNYYDHAEIITPDDGFHYLFGYYDLRPYSDGRHLTLRIPEMHTLPTAEDIAEIGFVKDRIFTTFATTTAWNYQQSALLQWHPTEADTVFYNAFKDDKCVTVTHNIKTGSKKHTDRPAACISPDGKWGLSVNFGRIFDFRPGYGYAGCTDQNTHINWPADDGVFLVDMASGISKQLVDYRTLGKIGNFAETDKILVNHITFNTDSTRYCMLLRNFPDPGSKISWRTSLMVGDLQGNVNTILSKTYVSHYVWLDENHLIAHCGAEPTDEEWRWIPKNASMYCINMTNGSYQKWDMPYFHENHNPDIHCNITPGCDYVIGDGYPIDGYRCLMAYNMKTGTSRELFRCATSRPQNADTRCDLHARFIDGGKYISFDTTMNGKRQIATIPTTALNF